MTSFVGWPTILALGRRKCVVQGRDLSAGRRISRAGEPASDIDER
jgi:hypothetical protein